MQRTSPKLVEKCRFLRKQGATLGEIVRAVRLPKTTVYTYIVDIPLLPTTRERIRIASTKRINEFNIRERRGKCIPGRVVSKPTMWSDELVLLLAHFSFDGGVRRGTCIYSNRSIALINRVKKLARKLFGVAPKSITQNPYTGVYRITYHYIELSDYILNKTQELYGIIRKEKIVRKRLFLRAFFDDEGNVTFRMRKKRQVRGFQYNTTQHFSTLWEIFWLTSISQAQSMRSTTKLSSLGKKIL